MGRGGFRQAWRDEWQAYFHGDLGCPAVSVQRGVRSVTSPVLLVARPGIQLVSLNLQQLQYCWFRLQICSWHTVVVVYRDPNHPNSYSSNLQSPPYVKVTVRVQGVNFSPDLSDLQTSDAPRPRNGFM
ncbi:hypothetical protein BaRGS_00008052 [Batillaria attramentaria]|uniref:Uncharacterized protein n=1 Tax=Batillaria attramentaria TaxID=370345 RepID=A0ABD0LP75_9CAEN